MTSVADNLNRLDGREAANAVLDVGDDFEDALCATATLEITEFRPPLEYVVASEEGGFTYRTVIRVIATGSDTCRLEREFFTTAHTIIARVMGMTLMPLMTRMMVGLLQEELDALKSYCEKSSTRA